LNVHAAAGSSARRKPTTETELENLRTDPGAPRQRAQHVQDTRPAPAEEDGA
jgi:hypothetical protein